MPTIDLNILQERELARLLDYERATCTVDGDLVYHCAFPYRPDDDLQVELIAHGALMQKIDDRRGTVVTISHDRYFLDRTVTRIIEIQDGKAEFYSGNYSFYAIEKERRYQERMKQYLKEQAKIQQLEKAAEQMHGIKAWQRRRNRENLFRRISMQIKTVSFIICCLPTGMETMTGNL